MSTTELIFICTLASGIVGVATFFIGRNTAARAAGSVDGALHKEIENLKNAVNDLRQTLPQMSANSTDIRVMAANVEFMRSEITDLKKAVSLFSDSVPRTSERLDAFERRVAAIETQMNKCQTCSAARD